MLEKYMLLINQNLTRENQIILLMITDGKKWHYLTVRTYLDYLEE